MPLGLLLIPCVFIIVLKAVDLWVGYLNPVDRQFILANFPSGSAIKPESIIVFWQLVLQVPYLECVGYSAGESKAVKILVWHQSFTSHVYSAADFL